MSIVATLRLQAQPEKVEELKAMLKADLPHTQQFDGCQGVNVYRNQDAPDSIMVWGYWNSRAHFEKYFNWRNARGDFTALAALLAEPPSIAYLDPWVPDEA